MIIHPVLSDEPAAGRAGPTRVAGDDVSGWVRKPARPEASTGETSIIDGRSEASAVSIRVMTGDVDRCGLRRLRAHV